MAEEQEKFMQLQMLDQQYSQVMQQLQFIEQELLELDEFSKSLSHLQSSDEKEILAPLGRGVYMPASRHAEKKLYVEVGAGVVVLKTPDEAAKVVESQLEQLKTAYHQLKNQESFYTMQLQQLMS